MSSLFYITASGLFNKKSSDVMNVLGFWKMEKETRRQAEMERERDAAPDSCSNRDMEYTMSLLPYTPDLDEE